MLSRMRPDTTDKGPASGEPEHSAAVPDRMKLWAAGEPGTPGEDFVLHRRASPRVGELSQRMQALLLQVLLFAPVSQTRQHSRCLETRARHKHPSAVCCQAALA